MFYGGVSFLNEASHVIATIQLLEDQASVELELYLSGSHSDLPSGELWACVKSTDTLAPQQALWMFSSIVLRPVTGVLPAWSFLLFSNLILCPWLWILLSHPLATDLSGLGSPDLPPCFCPCSTLGNKRLERMQFEIVTFWVVELVTKSGRLNSRTSH